MTTVGAAGRAEAIAKVRAAGPWDSLKYEVREGIESEEFRCHPSALEFIPPAERAILRAPPGIRRGLVAAWSSTRRPVALADEPENLRRYATAVVYEIVERARRVARKGVG